MAGQKVESFVHVGLRPPAVATAEELLQGAYNDGLLPHSSPFRLPYGWTGAEPLSPGPAYEGWLNSNDPYRTVGARSWRGICFLPSRLYTAYPLGGYAPEVCGVALVQAALTRALYPDAPAPGVLWHALAPYAARLHARACKGGEWDSWRRLSPLFARLSYPERVCLLADLYRPGVRAEEVVPLAHYLHLNEGITRTDLGAYYASGELAGYCASDQARARVLYCVREVLIHALDHYYREVDGEEAVAAAWMAAELP